MVKRVRTVLYTLVTPPCSNPADVEKELHAMGKAVVPILRSLDYGFDASAQIEVMARVRFRLNDKSVSRWLADLASGSNTLITRTTAYRCLEEFGTIYGLAGLLDGRTEESPSVRRCANRAIVAVLKRSDTPEAYRVVRSRLTSGDGAPRINVITSVAKANSILGLKLLCELLGDDRVRNRLLLFAIATMSVRPAGDEPAGLIRPFLESDDPKARQGAIEALASLCDEASAEKLIASLRDENPEVGAAAHAALKELSFSNLPAKEGPWRDWLEVERAWWSGKGLELKENLWGSDRERVIQAVGQFARHPLFRGHIGGRVEVLSSATDPVIRDAAKKASARLRLQGRAALRKKRDEARRSRPRTAARPSPTGRAPVQVAGAGRNGYLYLLLLGIPVCLLLLMRVCNFSPLEWVRARTRKGPMIVKLDRENATPEPDPERKTHPDISQEELFYRSARNRQG